MLKINHRCLLKKLNQSKISHLKIKKELQIKNKVKAKRRVTMSNRRMIKKKRWLMVNLLRKRSKISSTWR